MKKKKLLIILCLLLILGIVYNFYDHYKNTRKFQCETNTDCIMSYSDTEDFQMCVNSDYFETAKKVHYQCISDPKNVLSCSCENNICVRSDKKTGCN